MNGDFNGVAELFSILSRPLIQLLKMWQNNKERENERQEQERLSELSIRKKQIEVYEEELALMRHVLEEAHKIVEIIYPDANAEERRVYVQRVASRLLQVYFGGKLELLILLS